jgi:hypothetical protein
VIGARMELRAERDAYLSGRRRPRPSGAEGRSSASCASGGARTSTPGRRTFDGLADEYVDELANSAPKGDQAGGG